MRREVFQIEYNGRCYMLDDFRQDRFTDGKEEFPRYFMTYRGRTVDGKSVTETLNKVHRLIDEEGERCHKDTRQ